MRRIAICMICILGIGLAAAQTVSLAPEQQEVWAGEEAYWTYVDAGDADAFRLLWDERFVGWPCDLPTTENYSELRSAVDDWFADVAAKGKKTRIEPEGIVVDDEFAITYVAATTTWRDDAGVQNYLYRKLTHTWRRTDNGWNIIGGMCGPRPNSNDQP